RAAAVGAGRPGGRIPAPAPAGRPAPATTAPSSAVQTTVKQIRVVPNTTRARRRVAAPMAPRIPPPRGGRRRGGGRGRWPRGRLSPRTHPRIVRSGTGCCEHSLPRPPGGGRRPGALCLLPDGTRLRRGLLTPP